LRVTASRLVELRARAPCPIAMDASYQRTPCRLIVFRIRFIYGVAAGGLDAAVPGDSVSVGTTAAFPRVSGVCSDLQPVLVMDRMQTCWFTHGYD
jgi:hypothetical protein